MFIGKHIQVTIKNAVTPTPYPRLPGGGSEAAEAQEAARRGRRQRRWYSIDASSADAACNIAATDPSDGDPATLEGRQLKLLVDGFAQTAARRGEQFAVAMFVIRSDTGKQITTGKVTCALAGKRLVWHGWYHKAAGCRWAIPTGAKLGRITGSLSVTAKRLTLKRKFTANVKPGRGAV